jgi:hypothetical protein
VRAVSLEVSHLENGTASAPLRLLVGTYVAVRDAAGLGVRDERGNEERAGPWRLRGSRKSHVFALALNSLALDQVDATQVLDGRAGLACRTSASSPTGIV